MNWRLGNPIERFSMTRLTARFTDASPIPRTALRATVKSTGRQTVIGAFEDGEEGTDPGHPTTSVAVKI